MTANQNRRAKTAVLIALVAAMLFVPGSLMAEEVKIDADFGSVAVGSSNTSTVTIFASPLLQIVVTDFSFSNDSSADFSVKTGIPEGGFVVQPGEHLDIEITFAPTSDGPAAATLHILSADPILFSGVVNLTGTGVAPQKAAAGGVKGILAFFDNSVSAGTLAGKGKGKSALQRLITLRKMIEESGKMIENNQTDGACRKLLGVLKKADGKNSKGSPMDFVHGKAAAGLAEMIASLTQELGCN